MQPPPPPAVAKFHSIIGSLRPTGVDKSTDGVVPYRSAHLEGRQCVDERVVRSDHGVQKDPEAIREVRDILRQHVGLPPVSADGASPPRLSATPIPAASWKSPPRRSGKFGDAAAAPDDHLSTT